MGVSMRGGALGAPAEERDAQPLGRRNAELPFLSLSAYRSSSHLHEEDAMRLPWSSPGRQCRLALLLEGTARVGHGAPWQ